MNNKRFKEAVRTILKEIGEDVDREGIKSTPDRVCRMYNNLFYGYHKKLVVMDEKERNGSVKDNVIPITIFKSNNNDLLIRNTTFTSFCEHHMVPFSGKAWVGIIPGEKLLGMNKIDKIVKYFAGQLQIQEKMTSQIADWIFENISPLGVIVVVKADHYCARLQGDNGEFVTSTVRGCFADNDRHCKEEFFELIKLQ